MAMGEGFTAPVEGIAAGGAGIARFEGRPVFVELTAPQDTVKARITAEHRTWARGELIEVLDPSPLRVTPPCPLYGRCGGCSLQHIDYKAQIAAKTTILKDAFTRIGGMEAPAPHVITANPWEYRNRVQFHCTSHGSHTSGGAAPLAGFKSRKSDDVVPLSDCPVADPGIRAALQRAAIKAPHDKNRFTVYSRGDLFLTEGGMERGRVTICGKNLVMDAGVFFQSNGALLETLIADILAIAEEADPELPAVDLYCGVGTFAFFLKDRFHRIDLVEENKAALTLARENAGTGGKEYYALKDEAWARLQLAGKQAGKNGAGKRDAAYSFIIADPPRQGLSPGLKRALTGGAGTGALLTQLLAYVSCDPAALARDSRELTAGGYTLTELRLYDFYPQTAHIESLAVFRR
ncbi:MAG: TRAM domain-containing protein [Treponema sp.]|jgi:23S rRNA (uracil1939-C5)-methyltransferase|nr:TRAM domain-containing protein [Treponema sp.]